LEVFDNISANPESPDYFKNRVNGISDLIWIDEVTENDKKGKRPAEQALTFLVNPTEAPEQYDGSENSSITAADYRGTAETKTINGEQVIERNGLEGFKYVDEISIVCAPDDNLEGVYAELVNHCEDPALQDRFAILQSKPEQTPVNINNTRLNIDSSYAAFY
jgi:hypothetical protein